MHTDFNKDFFNTRIKNCINMLLQQIETPQFFTTNLLTDLLLEFKRYYKEERQDAYKTEEHASTRASEVLSEFLQYLVGHVAHSSLTKLHIYRVIAQLLNHDLFHHYSPQKGYPPKMIVWHDPKSGNTTMHHLACLDDTDDMRNTLNLLEKHHGSKTAVGYKEALTLINKQQFSILSIACQTGSAAAVALLLEVAKGAYETESSEGFRAFLNHKTVRQLSPLNLAVAAGCEKIVFLLLQAAIKAFGGITSPDFRAYLTYSNQQLYSPLNQATYKAELPIVKLLLETAEQAYQGNEAEYRKFIDHQNKFGLSPFAVACQQGTDPHREIAVLLQKHRADSDIKNSQGLSARTMAPPHWDFLMPKLEEPKKLVVVSKHRMIIIKKFPKTTVQTQQSATQPCHRSTKRLMSVSTAHGQDTSNRHQKRLRHEAAPPVNIKKSRAWQ